LERNYELVKSIKIYDTVAEDIPFDGPRHSWKDNIKIDCKDKW